MDAAKRHPLYKAEAAPETPTLPVELEYLWELYLRMSRRRQNGMGMNPLSSTEVLAWLARRRRRLDPFEHDILDQIDDVYLSTHYKKDK